MKHLLLGLLLTVAPQILCAQTAPKTLPVHVSLVQPISVDGRASGEHTYQFSFNIFSGTVGGIKGLQIGSLYNQVNGDVVGVQYSGLLNVVKGNVTGYQTGGITNISKTVVGVQQAGISNHAKDVTGVQMAGIANTASNVTGVQLGGILNRAKRLNGLQIGLINVADSVGTGAAIGLINIVRKNGYREIELSSADYQTIGISYKSGVRWLYSILSMGYSTRPQSLFSAGAGIGGVVASKANWHLKPELITYSYVTDRLDFDMTTQSTHLRVGFMRTAGKVGITIMPSVYYANIPKRLEGDLTETSLIQPFVQTNRGRFGFGLALGVALLK